MSALSCYCSQQMATLFSLRTHLDAFLQRLFQNVHYVTHRFWEEAKSIFCISVTAEWSQRNDCRKCFWWISFAGLPSDRVLVLAWNSMRERQVQGNDKHSTDCPPHGTSLHGLDDVAPLPMPVTSFYLTQRQWGPAHAHWASPEWMKWRNKNKSVWTGEHGERWCWHMVYNGWLR